VASSGNGTVVAQCYQDGIGEGGELVEPVVITAHDPGCTGIDEPFVQEVDIFNAGLSCMSMVVVKGYVIVDIGERDVLVGGRDVIAGKGGIRKWGLSKLYEVIFSGGQEGAPDACVLRRVDKDDKVVFGDCDVGLRRRQTRISSHLGSICLFLFVLLLFVAFRGLVPFLFAVGALLFVSVLVPVLPVCAPFACLGEIS